MSFCATAMSAAKTAVDAPTQVTTVRAVRGSAGERAGLHERIDARDEIDAGSDHRGGVNERGDGRGAFHRVGQPDVQRKLAALAGGSGKDEQADGAGGGEAEASVLREQAGERPAFHGAGAVVIEEQRAGLSEEPDDAEEKEDVADARGEEGFLGGGGGGGLLIPEADEQVGGEADQFPAHEEQQDAVGDDDAEHGSGKEREEAEEAGEVLVVGHVADGVDEDEQADEADHHEHDGGERIEDPAEIDGGRAELEPGEVDGLADRCAVRPSGNDVREGDEREEERDAERTDGERGGELCAAAA